jgi:transaldolase
MLNIKIFADTADLNSIKEMRKNSLVSGFTTNPSLARKAGVGDYREFIRSGVMTAEPDPISFEVIADDFSEMRRQALWIAAQGENVYVKIPITNTQGESSIPLIRELSATGVKLNVTAIFTPRQIDDTCDALVSPSILSVFAGRISDAGQACERFVAYAVSAAQGKPISVLWASAREPYNVIQAEQVGAHIITLFPDFIRKLSLFGKDLEQFSLETVQMFYRDATESGFTL